MHDLSIAVAVYNEEESLPHLCAKLHDVLSKLGKSYEIVLVDDGSTDKSWAVMNEQANRYPNLKLVKFRRNYGQTAAMSAGIAESDGAVLVTLDADLQNDPADIPALLAKLDEGYDVVSGWRKNRQDAFINRKLPSMMANRLIGKLTGVQLHDYGCSLKAYRRDIIGQVRLYGEMHRFIPALCRWVGGTVTEIPVNHHARQFGTSKYGISRTLRVVLDLLTVKFLLTYSTRPIQVFGKIGLHFAAFALLLAGVVGLEALLAVCGVMSTPWWGGLLLVKRPFWVITPLMFLGFALQFIVLGLLAELTTRTYHESQNKAIYDIREIAQSPEFA
ncbi:MAG: glycosyltransferase family 2 protein [Kiritimatiellae bacterium]|nr:glycosyltransferase family 2 protein [Kiritimatiellia bacterium]